MMGIIFPHKAKVISVSTINHDVILLQVAKPWKFDFNIGQAVDLSIDKPGYELAVAPFTIANVPTDDYLEFVIKISPHTDALTQGIALLQPNDIVQLSFAWDSYAYKGSGTFIAAGTGITPFLPIFSSMENDGIDLKKEHMLIYANKTKKDVLYYKKLKQLFSTKLSVILSRTKSKNLQFGKIDKEYLVNLVQSTEQHFYICGPKQFEEDIKTHLITIGVQQGNIQTGYKF
jgi:ferredoxin-NADP reductase